VAAQLASAAPRDFELRMFYARILRDQRKFRDATREFQAAASLEPKDAMAWSELAGMLILDEQFPEALLALDRVRELGGEKPGHVFFRATTLDRLNQKKEALEYYQRFIEVSRTNPDEEFQARQRAKTLERELGRK
jgi:tetratricopeptide (TPR) repeat protein